MSRAELTLWLVSLTNQLELRRAGSLSTPNRAGLSRTPGPSFMSIYGEGMESHSHPRSARTGFSYSKLVPLHVKNLSKT
jgi:hypothetical protein